MDYLEPYAVLDNYYSIPQTTMPLHYYMETSTPSFEGYSPVNIDLQSGHLYMDGQDFGSIDDLVSGY